MDTERSAVISIGGVDYELVLTTRATKEIAGRYGGLENLGDKLMKSENFEMAIDEIVWLISLLANQSILIYNLKHKDIYCRIFVRLQITGILCSFLILCFASSVPLLKAFTYKVATIASRFNVFSKKFSTETGVAAAGKPAAAHLLIHWQSVWSGIFSGLR